MTAASAIDAARDHARDAVKRSGTSFAAGMAILPKARREAMHAIYAFCREVDDIADDDGISSEERRRRLSGWRDEIDRLFAGRPERPAGVALLEPVRAFNLPKREFLLMIEGMEMDAAGPIIAPSMERLFAYTRRVAGSVGMLSMPVFGAPQTSAADNFALSLADALQLTNILRDVKEDAAIGRLYLPAELLEKYGAPNDPAQLFTPSPALNSTEGGLSLVAQEVAIIASRKFADARAALRHLDWRTVRPALLMMGVYEAYLQRITSRGFQNIGEAISISGPEKLAIAMRWYFAPKLERAI